MTAPSAPLVIVRARVRFMVFGQTPARLPEVDCWVLRVPESWVEGVSAGGSSPELTRRCGQAVEAAYVAMRDQALEAAAQSLAAGGDYDAGHHVLEGASVWRAGDEELRRRPWLGPRRVFRAIDEHGAMRPATAPDGPPADPLSPFEELVFAGSRAEETESWNTAEEAFADALRTDTADADPSLLGEAAAGRVRALGKMSRFDEAAAAVAGGLAVLSARGAAASAQAFVHARHGETLLDQRPRDAAGAFAAALALLGAEHPWQVSLRSSCGLALLRCGDFDAAGEHLSAAVALFEAAPESARAAGHAPALHNLALTLEHGGKLEDAERCLRAAIAQRERAGAVEHASLLESRLLLARVLARRGAAHASEARAGLDALRPFVAPNSLTDGIVRWIEALLARASGEDATEIARRFERAADLLRADAVWSSWLADDRRSTPAAR